MFRDRKEVGQLLADRIRKLNIKNPIVLAIPRGGVPVAREIALAIRAPLDLVITRKIGFPGEPEYAIGAVTQEGHIIVDHQTVSRMGVTEKYLKEEAERQTKEIQSRMERYRGETSYPDLKGKDVIIVDDGIATGNTILAAIESVRRKNPASIILAIGVAPPDAIRKLTKSVDSVICLDTPEPFFSIGEFYVSFEQVDDDEVQRILTEVNSRLDALKK
ncbi:MAG TPA: phosphoribosyltransferase [Nitrososphaerales archaeon]|nr:phosphoribosyltransferase [Nitrososphaerales archaeon]